MGRLEPRAEWESRLVGKVCDLCRVLETGISAMLMVKSSLGILFDYNPDLWYFLLEGVPPGNNWVITKTWLYL
jgi:hypothetical protein